MNEKILGLSKPVFYGVAGLTVLLVGYGIYSAISKSKA